MHFLSFIIHIIFIQVTTYLISLNKVFITKFMVKHKMVFLLLYLLINFLKFCKYLNH